MKNFIETFKKSIWGKEHYAVMASRSYKSGFRYFFSLTLIVSFVVVVSVSFFMIPKGIGLLNTLSYIIASKYPNDLVLNFSGGMASTSVSRVYKMAITTELFSEIEVKYLKNNGIENFIVIDTKDNFQNLTQFRSAKTMTLLAKDALVVLKEKGSLEINPIPKNFNKTITKEQVSYFISKIGPMIKYMIPIAVIFAFASVFLFTSLIYLFLALISGLFMWLISSIVKRKGNYKEFFITSLYAITLAVVVNLALSFFGQMSFLLSLIVTLLVWAINVEIWKKVELPVNEADLPPENI